jgi:Fur family peroxide stress response transcriptional regulator
MRMLQPLSSGDPWARLAEALRGVGLPLTLQRRLIFEAVRDRTDHPSADSIFEEVRRRAPGISRTTVYRTLDLFVRLGLIARAQHHDVGVRFDPRTDRHHHLVCVGCRKIVDFEDPGLNRIPLPASGHGFEIADYSVYFRGLCPDCRRPAQGRSGNGGARRRRAERRVGR